MELDAGNHREAGVQAHLAERAIERPIEGMKTTSQFHTVQMDIEDMKAKFDVFSQQTEGRIAAAQGTAAPCLSPRFGH